jgi:hypothetical protein
MTPIETLLTELKGVNSQMEELKTKDSELRKELMGRIEDEGLTDGFSNDTATVSYNTRKSVKIEDEQKLLDTLVEKQCVRYYAIQLTPAFEKDVKDKKLTPEHGLFTADEVKVETSNNISVRFK